EVDRERCLRSPRNTDEDDVRLVETCTHSVVVLDGELHRFDPAKVRRVQRRTRTRSHACGLAGNARHGIDRMSEEIAVMDARTSTEAAHRIAHLRLDERVNDDGRPATGASDRKLEILDGFDSGVA